MKEVPEQWTQWGLRSPANLNLAKNQRCIGTAKAEAIGHDRVKLSIIDTLLHDRHTRCGLVQFIDMRRFRNEPACCINKV